MRFDTSLTQQNKQIKNLVFQGFEAFWHKKNTKSGIKIGKTLEKKAWKMMKNDENGEILPQT